LAEAADPWRVFACWLTWYFVEPMTGEPMTGIEPLSKAELQRGLQL
jgi:hypothetical protein